MNESITLDTSASQNALEWAIRTQAQIVLESAVIPNTTVNGSLISGDEHALLLEITGQPARDPNLLVDAAAQVQVYSDRRYSFATTITAAPHWGDTRALAIDRPSILTVVDRRRFVRARLAPSSLVKVEWRHAGADHRRVATLLNISADGLACRIEDPAAMAIEPRDPLRVQFSLPGQHSTFHLTAAASNVTPAGGGATILGLQFTRSMETAQLLKELRASLRSPHEAGIESEALV
ncbi:MAG TPA: PilZ domain-containing protein [Phycisphaerae bacterium]|nr:PilZ domain-containing protein [Phycisphaerae bacterium]